MIKFLKKIRKTLISENRFSKYLLYAIGEIILVVIGILIALGVNNAYNKKKEQQDLEQYYVKIIDEITASMLQFESFRQTRIESKQYGVNALELLAAKNEDSIGVLLKKIGTLKRINSITPSFPTIEEFLSQPLYTTIKNDSLKTKFIEFTEMYKFVGLVDKYNIDQYQLNIEPYLTKHFNYMDIDEGLLDVSIDGGPPSDTASLWDNLELWNLIFNKIETWQYEEGILDWGLRVLEELKTMIQQELEP